MQTQKEKYLLFRIRVYKDQNAFAEIYDLHVASLHRFLVTKLPTMPDVEDTASTVFFRLWNYLKVSEVENVAGLIFTIARSAVAEFYRNRPALNTPLEKQTIQPESKESGEKITAQAEIELVKRAMAELNDVEKTVVAWRHFEGLSVGEIADRLQKSENATAVYLHRALKRLRAILQKYE